MTIINKGDKMKKIFLITSLIITLFFASSSLNAQNFSYGIARTTNHERPNPGRYIENILEETNSIYIGKDTQDVYLTFDCGYENGYTAKILDVLKEKNIKACFFITGHYLTSATSLVKRMSDEGHIVGNHLYNHKNMAKSNNNQIKKEIESLEKKYEELIGTSMDKYIRPPEGNASKESIEYTNSLGYKTVFWSLAYIDWYKDKVNGMEYSYNNVISRIHNGAIILMHTVSPDNASALGSIIDKLIADGYNCCSIDTIV